MNNEALHGLAAEIVNKLTISSHLDIQQRIELTESLLLESQEKDPDYVHRRRHADPLGVVGQPDREQAREGIPQGGNGQHQDLGS